jgi:hypothetical protein
LAIFANSLAVFAANIQTLKKEYPHWDLSNPSTITKLQKIDNFIKANSSSSQKNLAVFDWDGTLYNENIPVKDLNNEKFAGQPAWYIWAANHDAKNNVFPMFRTVNNQFLNDVITKDKYLEGRITIQNPDHAIDQGADIYSKFTQTSIFTAGMTPKNIVHSVNKYLRVSSYSPKHNAFLPMLDVLQRMVNTGFDVWIVTGSNPYFVSVEIKYIENHMDYTPGKKYDFGSALSTIPYNSATGHIAGNGLKLLKKDSLGISKFSVVYDDQYVKNVEDVLYIVDHEGKCIAMENIEKKDSSNAVFVAGNSDGDLEDTTAVVQSPYHLAIAVNPDPTSKLAGLAKDHSNIVVLTAHEAAPQI